MRSAFLFAAHETSGTTGASSCLARRHQGIRGVRRLDYLAARLPREGPMAQIPITGPTSSEPPRWALEQAIQEVDEGESVTARAWELVRARQQRDDERHDEYDDPDQGGES